MRNLLLWLVVTAALSGCAVQEGGPSGLGSGSDWDASFDEFTGALRVSVEDQEVRPIARATVRLTPSGAEDSTPPAMTQTTSDLGKTAFSNVSPGTYRLEVQAPGFEVRTLDVEIREGQVTEATVTLVALPSDGPYHETTTASGLVRSVVWRVGPSCDTVIQPPLGTCLGFQAEDVTVRVVLTPDWATVVDEATWVPNTAGFHQRAYVFATFPNVTDFSGVPDFKSPGHFEAGGPTPVVLRIERETLYERGFPEQNHFGGERGTRFRHVNNFDDVSAADVVSAGVMIDQPMDAFITVFHQAVAPADFTMLADE